MADVNDDLARFRRAILRGGVQMTELLSGVRKPNFTKLGDQIGRSSQHCHLFQISDILLHFQTRAAQSCVMLKTTPNFARFDPL